MLVATFVAIFFQTPRLIPKPAKCTYTITTTNALIFPRSNLYAATIGLLSIKQNPAFE
jgi:hypothetical protein